MVTVMKSRSRGRPDKKHLDNI